MDIDRRYINQIEVLTNVFTIDKNSLKVYLIRRLEEPFKGYWMLPSNLLMTSETIEECALATIEEYVGIKGIHIEQCNVFSKVDRLPNDRILGNSVIGIIDEETLLMHKKKTPYEGVWFNIDEIPKMIFDHANILKDAANHLKSHLNNPLMLKMFFPSDFTLPELQIVYEQILGKKLDRRNFRKRILNLGILEDTNYKTNNKMGRPAKLYRFKESEIEYYE
ncbi:MAG: NUDIX hydrolase [Bacilli bacterium]|nr:NUDIX hydrolase [Bacilli bacterium]